MKINRFLIIIIFCLFIIPAYSADKAGYSIIYYVDTGDYSEFLDFTVNYAEKSGGFVKFYSDTRVVLRLPMNAVSLLKNDLAKRYYIRDERVSRSDFSERISMLRTQLRVKEQTLEKFTALFNNSGFLQTLSVEREIGKLIVEIEQIKGSLNYYNDRMKFAEVIVNTGRLIQPVQKITKTRWSWIKKMGIPGLVGSFANEE